MTRTQVLQHLRETREPITEEERSLCGSGLHYCNDWGDEPIDALSPEIDTCTHYDPSTGHSSC